MLEAVVAFIVYIADSFTGGVLENVSIRATCGSRDDEEDIQEHEVERLLPETHSLLSEFTRFDLSDTIFQEFDPPDGAFGIMAWKKSRPSRLKTFCLLYTSPSPRDQRGSRMPSSA